ncbi:MAG: FtsX-like permease family protein [Bacillota bacterium]
MALPNYIYPLQSETEMMPPPTFGIGVISKDDFVALNRGSSFYAVKFNQPGPHSRQQSAEVRELLESRGINVTQWTDTKDNKRVSFVNAEGEVLELVSRGIPTAIMLLAGIMVANVIWRLINQESAVTGALYALGYRRKEIYRHYLIYPLLIALIGSVIGTLIGILPVRPVVEFMFSSATCPWIFLKMRNTAL